MEVDGSFRGSRWRDFHLETSIHLHLLPPTSMEVGGSFHGSTSMEVDSMEVDGNFHGSTLKNHTV